jgi:hypothetical protein
MKMKMPAATPMMVGIGTNPPFENIVMVDSLDWVAVKNKLSRDLVAVIWRGDMRSTQARCRRARGYI